jgi:peptide/nickel transport system ATP-binding protein/oligopeptide transport system ATP-binding protein
MTAVREPVLQAEGLVKHFPTGQGLFGRGRAVVRAVDGVSFTLAAGQTFAIVGESGCGKSTLARLLLRLIEPDAGRILLGGESLLDQDPRALRRLRGRIQMIFQDPYGSLNPRMTAGDILAEPLMLHTGLAPADRGGRVAELLDRVGLPADAARRWPHEFSGGQRQRLAIARALAAGPELIVCDEPVSALDVSIQAQILNLLAQLQRELGLAYVFISHDLAVVRQVADVVGVMYLGQLVETGPADQVFAAPRHPYTQALLAAVPQPDPSRRGRRVILSGDVPSPIAPPPGCRFHTRCAHADAQCREAVPALVAIDGRAGRAAAAAGARHPDRGDPAAGGRLGHGGEPAEVQVACWHWARISANGSAAEAAGAVALSAHGAVQGVRAGVDQLASASSPGFPVSDLSRAEALARLQAAFR